MTETHNWSPIFKYTTAVSLRDPCSWNRSGRQEVSLDVRKGDRIQNLHMLLYFPRNTYNWFVVMMDLFHC